VIHERKIIRGEKKKSKGVAIGKKEIHQKRRGADVLKFVAKKSVPPAKSLM